MRLLYLIKNFDRMHGCSLLSLLLTSFMLELCSVNIFDSLEELSTILDVQDIWSCMCVIMVCAMTVQGVKRIFNIASLRQTSPHNVTGYYCEV